MCVIAVVSIVVILLIVAATIISAYKLWMDDATGDDSPERHERQQGIVQWMTNMSGYSLAFFVLSVITLNLTEDLTEAKNFDDLRFAVSLALGVLGLIEGSVLLGFARDLWKFVLVDDWGMSKPDRSRTLVKETLNLTTLGLLCSLLVAGFLVYMVLYER